MSNIIRIAILVAFCITGFAQRTKPPAVPQVFLPDNVSTALNERDMAISPDGTEMYYTLLANQNAFSTIILRKKMANGQWSDPVVAPFSGSYKDLEPAFSPDGKKLYFSSNRPAEGKPGNDYDIWVVERNDRSWSTPRRLGPAVNTTENEYYPSVTTNGDLYFTAAYDKGIGKEDIYLSRWDGKQFLASVPLDSSVNSKTWEFNAFVAPDASYILFTSYGRSDDQGGGDLYISFRNGNGWYPALHVDLLSSPKLDYCPFVTADQQILFFTSERHNISAARDTPATYSSLLKEYNGTANGSDDIYWVDFAKLKESLQRKSETGN